MSRKSQPDEVLLETNELEPMVGFAHISGNYFNAAERLRKLAWEGPENWHSHFTIPALITFATALEVFINERSSKELGDLTLSKTKFKICKKPFADPRNEKMRLVSRHSSVDSFEE